MGVGESGAGNFNVLRQRVKKVMRRLNLYTPPTPEEQSLTAAQQQAYRSHLYQIELEMQDEELRRTQLALERERARFVSLLEYTSVLYNQAPIGYLTLTAEGLVVEANLTATKLLEGKRERLLKQSIMHFILAEDRAIFESYHKQLLTHTQSRRCELRMLRPDGSHFFVQMDATIIKDLLEADDHVQPNKAHYVRITISDISARIALEEEERTVRAALESTLLDLRQTQEQMVKQERLAVVGQLAAGIAHDFNNILAAITLYSQLVMRAADLPTKLHGRMEAIVAQSDRAAALIQQILDFSRRSPITPQSTSLSAFLQQLLDLLQHALPETIQTTLKIDSLRAEIDDIVEIDPTRIQQVLLNLAVNARDAMPNGGELQIRLVPFQVDEEPITVASGTLLTGSWLRLDVSDTGTGIQPEDLSRLFEPFFTTKGVGKGSGLGLSQVWGIIKQHNGEVDVTSKVGNGSTFSIFLPAHPQTQPSPPLVETNTLPTGHGERVLIVEDNDEVRAALVVTLTQLGYQTVDVSNGQEAVNLMNQEGVNQEGVNQEGDRIALILSDLIMPILGGEALIHQLRAQGWHQPIVVLSGQPLSMSEIEQSKNKVRWIPKPPAVDQLALTLNQALKNPSTAGT